MQEIRVDMQGFKLKRILMSPGDYEKAKKSGREWTEADEGEILVPVEVDNTLEDGRVCEEYVREEK